MSVDNMVEFWRAPFAGAMSWVMVGFMRKFTYMEYNGVDIIGIEGFIFKTKTGELTIHAENIQLLTKSIRPLPDKFHGLVDKEMRYRKRYVDLIMNDETRKIFFIRSRIIDSMRRFFQERRFLEV